MEVVVWEGSKPGEYEERLVEWPQLLQRTVPEEATERVAWQWENNDHAIVAIVEI